MVIPNLAIGSIITHGDCWFKSKFGLRTRGLWKISKIGRVGGRSGGWKITGLTTAPGLLYHGSTRNANTLPICREINLHVNFRGTLCSL